MNDMALRQIELHLRKAESNEVKVHPLLERIEHYYHRWSTRHQLSKLSEHQLDDIGISQVQAERESKKPFWK